MIYVKRSKKCFEMQIFKIYYISLAEFENYFEKIRFWQSI